MLQRKGACPCALIFHPLKTDALMVVGEAPQLKQLRLESANRKPLKLLQLPSTLVVGKLRPLPLSRIATCLPSSLYGVASPLSQSSINVICFIDVICFMCFSSARPFSPFHGVCSGFL